MNAVAIFAKHPVPQRVHLRMAKFLGYEAAAKVQQALLEDNIDILRSKDYVLYIAYQHPQEEELFKKYKLPLVYQGEGHLGQRIQNVFKALLPKHDKVVLTAMDIVNNDQAIIVKAFDALNDKDNIVIAPAEDGAFSLIGMVKTYDIFDPMDWSAPDVFEKMKRRIEQKKLHLVRLPNLNDMDTIEELKRVKNFINSDKYVRTNKVLINQIKEW